MHDSTPSPGSSVSSRATPETPRRSQTDTVTDVPDRSEAAPRSLLEIQRLNDALFGRDLIWQAHASVEVNFGMTTDEAFTYLSRVSSIDSQKIRDIEAGPR
jgi:hypothetical protein